MPLCAPIALLRQALSSTAPVLDHSCRPGISPHDPEERLGDKVPISESLILTLSLLAIASCHMTSGQRDRNCDIPTKPVQKPWSFGEIPKRNCCSFRVIAPTARSHVIQVSIGSDPRFQKIQSRYKFVSGPIA